MSPPDQPTPRTRLIAAIDTADITQAKNWAAQLAGVVDAIKLGMEFVYGCGFDAAKDLSRTQPVFLDLKLHDIPNTVSHGLKSLASINACLLTIHASGGREMIARAREAIDAAYPPENRPALLAVTVLTSMDAAGLREIGVDATPAEQVLRLADVALRAGADGLVCSAQEITPIRQKFGAEPTLVVPGIRPAGSQSHDQKRVMTPGEAARMGADWIVVGRPITQAPDPAKAARAIQDEILAAT